MVSGTGAIYPQEWEAGGWDLYTGYLWGFGRKFVNVEEVNIQHCVVA